MFGSNKKTKPGGFVVVLALAFRGELHDRAIGTMPLLAAAGAWLPSLPLSFDGGAGIGRFGRGALLGHGYLLVKKLVFITMGLLFTALI